jgi:hypothetical protein
VATDALADCRSARTGRLTAQRWVPAVSFLLFVVGLWAASSYVARLPVADRFDDVVLFDMWAGLFGALVGFALVSCLYAVVWLSGLLALGDQVRPGNVAAWLGTVLLVLSTVFALLFAGGSNAAESVDKSLAIQSRPLIVVAALLQVPGLAAFLALRFIATEEGHWGESGPCRLRLVLRLRTELRRLLAMFGAFLTLLVITTGLRRRALVELDPGLALPAEQVLLYGLVFAALLGLFYVVAAGAIDRRAEGLLDEFAPLPDPADAALSDVLRRRTDLSSLTGSGGSMRTFETTVVIAAPLLTALIGSAIGS